MLGYIRCCRPTFGYAEFSCVISGIDKQREVALMSEKSKILYKCSTDGGNSGSIEVMKVATRINLNPNSPAIDIVFRLTNSTLSTSKSPYSSTTAYEREREKNLPSSHHPRKSYSDANSEPQTRLLDPISTCTSYLRRRPLSSHFRHVPKIQSLLYPGMMAMTCS